MYKNMIHKVQDAKSRKIHYRIMMVFVLIVNLFIYLFIYYLFVFAEGKVGICFISMVRVKWMLEYILKSL